MASLLEDQAAGLRKLFAGAHGPTRIAFAGREADGRGALMAGVARGLAAAGKEVLLIDGASGAASAAAALGLRPRFDLLQAVSRDVPAGRVLLGAGHGIRLLPAARALREYPRLAAAERRALDEWLRRQQGQADFVLGEARAGEAADPCPLLPQPQRLVVAVTPESQSITAAYTLMKRLATARGGARFLLAILGAGAEEADTVFGNLREVAARHLGARIDLVGRLAAAGDPQALGGRLAEALLGGAAPAPRQAMPRTARQAAITCPVV